MAQLTNEQQIRALIERWAKAIRQANRAVIREDHDENILMFDVSSPVSFQGLDAYMATWEVFFPRAEKPIVFHLTDVRITCGSDVAFATAIGHCVGAPGGKREALTFRLTMGLRKIDGKWLVTHEHHSLPVNEETNGHA